MAAAMINLIFKACLEEYAVASVHVTLGQDASSFLQGFTMYLLGISWGTHLPSICTIYSHFGIDLRTWQLGALYLSF
jgi:hypothetical protein